MWFLRTAHHFVFYSLAPVAPTAVPHLFLVTAHSSRVHPFFPGEIAGGRVLPRGGVVPRGHGVAQEWKKPTDGGREHCRRRGARVPHSRSRVPGGCCGFQVRKKQKRTNKANACTAAAAAVSIIGRVMSPLTHHTTKTRHGQVGLFRERREQRHGEANERERGKEEHWWLLL